MIGLLGVVMVVAGIAGGAALAIYAKRGDRPAPSDADQKEREIAPLNQKERQGGDLSFSRGSQREKEKRAPIAASEGASEGAVSERSEAEGGAIPRLDPSRSPAGATGKDRDHRARARGQPTGPPQAYAQEGGDPRTREPWVICGGLDGGGTKATLDVPACGWAPAAARLLEHRPRGALRVEGEEVIAKRTDGGVMLRAPGRALLTIRHDAATLAVPAAAIDRHGVEAWLERWPRWASRLLLALDLEPDQLHAHGWATTGLDVHVDVAGLDVPDSWVVLADAWTGRSARRRPSPDGYDDLGRLTGIWIGAKADSPWGRATAASLHAYRKSLEQAESARPNLALQARWAAQGYDAAQDGEVWRWEGHLTSDALHLRSEGDDGEERWNLLDPASWASSSAVSAAWAYIVGTPGANCRTGVIRLTDPADADRPRKMRGVHPIWELLRSAALGAPRARIVQVRATLEAEKELRLEKAEARVGRALGRLAGVAGAAETPAQASRFATAIVPKITNRDDWAEHVAIGRIENADLHEGNPRTNESEGEI